MWDPETGGGYDGLHADGANLNQGAESTLALISTLQHARALVAGAAVTRRVTRARHAGIALRPRRRPARVVTRCSSPARRTSGTRDSRAGPVVERILALDEDEVPAALDDVAGPLRARHRDLGGTFQRHAERAVPTGSTRRRPDSPTRAGCCSARRSPTSTRSRRRRCATRRSSPTRTRPSRPAAPAFVMSVRGDRRGAPVVDRLPHRRRRRRRARVTVDPPGPFADRRRHRRGRARIAPCLRRELAARPTTTARSPPSSSTRSADAVHDAAELDARLAALDAPDARPARTRRDGTIARLRGSPRAYAVDFAADDAAVRAGAVAAIAGRGATAWRTPASCASSTTTAPRLPTPPTPPTTASHISQQLLHDRRLPHVHLVARSSARAATQGPGAVPPPDRRALRRAVARRPRDERRRLLRRPPLLADGGHRPGPDRGRGRSLQLGNCGSPIETDAGWLVLTHGVGPMRTYSIGALLLDLDDPTRVIGRLRRPLLTPGARRAGRLRAQRRLLVRRARPRRHPGDPLRHRLSHVSRTASAVCITLVAMRPANSSW